jgi:6-pyruvoyl-tetrahydropterin synthase
VIVSERRTHAARLPRHEDAAASTMTGDDRLQLFVEHVTHIDCGVLDAQRGLRGATWLVDATLTGRRDGHGMLFDFGPAKALLKAEIDAWLDHRLLVPLRAPGLSYDAGALRLTTAAGEIIDYAGPESAITRLDCARIMPAALAGWLEARLAPRLPANIERLELRLRAEASDDAYYDYCHGLRAHGGNCQRLAHGHRCRLTIGVDGQDRPDYARAWARRWQGVFIGCRADLVETADRRLRFAYRAPQGDFALTIDAARCVLLDGPATVENIADHIADELARAEPGKNFTVRAYEGVGKGAIACRG